MERKLISGFRRIAGIGNWPRRVRAPSMGLGIRETLRRFLSMIQEKLSPKILIS